LRDLSVFKLIASIEQVKDEVIQQKDMSNCRIAILGSGNIGTDLLIKSLRSPYLTCVAFVGRSFSSAGMARAVNLGVQCSDQSIQHIIDHADNIDLVFDATSAKDHKKHASILKNLGLPTIDMTPAKVGSMVVPAVNLDNSIGKDNINMVTCGGQASIPIAHAISKVHSDINYIEVVSSIASKSAGPATRINLDEYINTTEEGIRQFTGVAKSKAILNLNPAVPCIDMQTTIFAKVDNPNLGALELEINNIVSKVKLYVPGYQIIVGPIYENNRIIVMVRVQGLGDYLPRYAGNLDIINCAAIAIAEEHAKRRNIR
jgi:acetaldehyde dehydrogenase (acetylating)